MSSYLVMDRAALMPYLFSGDGGHPMEYFRYRHKPYAPMERWYNAEVAVPVDWDAIACSYEYLLIDKPYDAARIPILTSVVAECERRVARGEKVPGDESITGDPHRSLAVLARRGACRCGRSCRRRRRILLRFDGARHEVSADRFRLIALQRVRERHHAVGLQRAIHDDGLEPVRPC